MQQRLSAAEAVLGQVDRRRRQFGQRSRWLITHAGLRAGCAGCGLLLLIVPFLGMAWLGWRIAMEQRGLEVADLVFILPCATPLFLMLLASAIVMASVRRRARQLREACAALPPSRPGEPAGCHVCGGPVAPEGTDPIARCGFCAADNVVTKDAMQAAERTRGQSLDAFEAHLREHAELAGRGMRRMVLTVVLFATVAPLLGFCGGCCLSRQITDMPTEPHLDREYFWTAGPEGMQCIGHVDWREETQARLRTPDCHSIGNSFPSTVSNGDLPEMFDVTSLEGRYLVHPRRSGRVEGQVIGVHGRLDGTNVLVMRVHTEHGAREREMRPTFCMCAL